MDNALVYKLLDKTSINEKQWFDSQQRTIARMEFRPQAKEKFELDKQLMVHYHMLRVDMIKDTLELIGERLSPTDVNKINMFYKDKNGSKHPTNGFLQWAFDNNVYRAELSLYVGSGQDFELLNKTITDLGYEKYRDFLNRCAFCESSGVMTVVNQYNFIGWFQMSTTNRRHYFPNVSDEEFRNSPTIQVQCAVMLYNDNLKWAKSNRVYDAAVAKGYSDDEIVRVCWLAPKAALQFFLYNNNDFKDANGVTAEDIIKKYREVK